MRSIEKCGGLDAYILQLRGSERKGTILAQQLWEEMTSVQKLQQLAMATTPAQTTATQPPPQIPVSMHNPS